MCSWKYSLKDTLLPFLPYIVGRTEVPTTGLRGLFCVCLLCKRNRNLHCSPTGVLYHSKGWHQDGATAQLSFRAGNSCPLQFCTNHRCYTSPAGKWFVRKEAQEDSWWAVWKAKTQAGVKGHTRENKATHPELYPFPPEENWRQEKGHMTAGIPVSGGFNSIHHFLQVSHVETQN